jgi:hypothetical protein
VLKALEREALRFRRDYGPKIPGRVEPGLRRRLRCAKVKAGKSHESDEGV